MATYKDYEGLFSNINHLEPPAGLLERIIFQIGEKQKRRVRIRTAVFGFLSLAAVVALVPAWQELQSEIVSSGFSQFISLLFSDYSVILTYWREFSLSLLESLPALGAAAVLGALFVLIFSLKNLIKDMNLFSAHHQFIRTNHLSI